MYQLTRHIYSGGMPVYKLSNTQVDSKEKFISKYIKANNAADGSSVDANSNVTQKSLATLEAELYKEDTIQINRKIIWLINCK